MDSTSITLKRFNEIPEDAKIRAIYAMHITDLLRQVQHIVHNNKVPISRIETICETLEALVFSSITIPDEAIKEYESLISSITSKTDE